MSVTTMAVKGRIRLMADCRSERMKAAMSTAFAQFYQKHMMEKGMPPAGTRQPFDKSFCKLLYAQQHLQRNVDPTSGRQRQVKRSRISAKAQSEPELHEGSSSRASSKPAERRLHGLVEAHIIKQRGELQTSREVYKEKGELCEVQAKLVDALWEGHTSKVELLRIKSTPEGAVHEQLTQLLAFETEQSRKHLEWEDAYYKASRDEKEEREQRRIAQASLFELRDKLKEDAADVYENPPKNERDAGALKHLYSTVYRMEKTLDLERAEVRKKGQDFKARMKTRWTTDHQDGR
ncbi:hypothetical protein R1sor_009563 [Riccia sorocarpa]|uniref:Uncharacterized protein n=1 Tax=Riccia sorocarpa TaxID=122646 RepID=A0ABD3HZ16_9MARC